MQTKNGCESVRSFRIHLPVSNPQRFFGGVVFYFFCLGGGQKFKNLKHKMGRGLRTLSSDFFLKKENLPVNYPKGSRFGMFETLE